MKQFYSLSWAEKPHFFKFGLEKLAGPLNLPYKSSTLPRAGFAIPQWGGGEWGGGEVLHHLCVSPAG